MPGRIGHALEIEALADFDRAVADGATSMQGWRIQGVDLSQRTAALLDLQPAGAILLGTTLSPEAENHLRARGALLFPAIPELPFDPYRARLYTPDELYDGLDGDTYAATSDALTYAWSRQPEGDLAIHLARALHDHAIDDALVEHLRDKPVVGVMGGHSLSRIHPGYAEAAHFGRSAAREGLVVATGGGPGAMEAANLGAYLSPQHVAVLEQALALLASTPQLRPSVAAWVGTAFDVRRRWPEGADSVGIPTWYYGHEPPNAFASSIAKYFQNSLREDTLLRHCDAGIAFLPGAAGTVQEIFQDACENYYAEPESLAPMVLVGERYWTAELPAWPLLQRLAVDRPMADALHLVASVDDAVAILAG